MKASVEKSKRQLANFQLKPQVLVSVLVLDAQFVVPATRIRGADVTVGGSSAFAPLVTVWTEHEVLDLHASNDHGVQLGVARLVVEAGEWIIEFQGPTKEVLGTAVAQVAVEPAARVEKTAPAHGWDQLSASDDDELWIPPPPGPDSLWHRLEPHVPPGPSKSVVPWN